MLLQQLKNSRNEENFKYFNKWVLEFFKREALRDNNRLDEYFPSPEFGDAMRPAVSYWNPNRSKHAEVYWLENYVFKSEVSPTNRVCNAMAVKFVGRPTLILRACDTHDYNEIIDFERYKIDTKYYEWINTNLDENKWDIPVWGMTQLQTSLQTAARNYVREVDKSDEDFKLSHMFRWISHLDDLGMTKMVTDPNNRLKDIVYWLKGFRGIGPYFSYHPPCNFSRDNDLPNIDEDDNVCTIGPGAQRGLEYVWPDVKFKNNDIMEAYILGVRDHQHEFFEFENDDHDFYKSNLERDGNLTTFGTEITFCQFSVFLDIRDNPVAQQKRMLPLRFDEYFDIADVLQKRMNPSTLTEFFG